MADKPLFSIVVPAYNAEKTIGTCLDALLRLGGDDYEVVVVNDGSRDCTADIIRNRINDDARVRFVSQDNAGVYRARRAGCAEARGEYCLFVDADDKVEPELLAALRPVLAPWPDMVVFNAFVGGGLLCDGTWLESLDLVAARREAVAGHLMNPIWNKCIRRELINLSRAEEDAAERLVYGEDAIQVASVLDLCDSVVGLNVALYRYETNAGSVTSTIDPLLRFKQGIRKQEILSVYMDKWGFRSTERGGFNANCLIYCADYCKALAERGDYRAMGELANRPFFTDAIEYYDKRLLTRNQKMLVTVLRAKSLIAARLLYLLAAFRRKVR